MELIGEKSGSNRNDKIQKVEPGNLLEESWFFGNLLNSTSTKAKMSRCNSDPRPCTKFNCRGEMLVGNEGKSSCSSTKKQLARAPSLPSSMARAVEKESLDFLEEGRKPNIGSSSLRNSLNREEEDEEDEFTMGRLIRQASLNSSDSLPPRRTSKSSTFPWKHRPSKTDTEGYKEMGQQYQTNQRNMAKSPSNFQPKEIQDLKALSLKSDKRSLEPDGPNKDKLRRSNSFSDASWHLKKSFAPTIPDWASAADSETKSAQDMKAHIKFWARAVASNALAPGVSITNQNC